MFIFIFNVRLGHLISILSVDNDHDFMIINKSGIAIRLRVEDLRVMGRATQGVKLINLRGNDEIAAVCSVIKDDEEDMENSDIIIDPNNVSDENIADTEAGTENNEE